LLTQSRHRKSFQLPFARPQRAPACLRLFRGRARPAISSQAPAHWHRGPCVRPCHAKPGVEVWLDRASNQLAGKGGGGGGGVPGGIYFVRVANGENDHADDFALIMYSTTCCITTTYAASRHCRSPPRTRYPRACQSRRI